VEKLLGKDLPKRNTHDEPKAKHAKTGALLGLMKPRTLGILKGTSKGHVDIFLRIPRCKIERAL
jgi:hypothetical protein